MYEYYLRESWDNDLKNIDFNEILSLDNIKKYDCIFKCC